MELAALTRYPSSPPWLNGILGAAICLWLAVEDMEQLSAKSAANFDGFLSSIPLRSLLERQGVCTQGRHLHMCTHAWACSNHLHRGDEGFSLEIILHFTLFLQSYTKS